MRQIFAAILVCLHVASAQAASGTIAGAIRWDLWYGATGGAGLASNVESYVECALGPSYWQFRAPWFAQVTGTNTIQIGAAQGNKQSVLDLEIQAAHAMGLTYWAYNWYPDATGAPLASGYNNAWTLHQSSAYKNLMNWALLIQQPSSPTAFIAMNAQFVTYMQQSNYQKVLSGRPVVFLLTGGLDATWAAAITDMRTKALAAGLATPYVVVLQGQGSGVPPAATAVAIGADAIGQYATFQNGTFASMTSYVQGEWSNYATAALANGLTSVPSLMLGSDTRPRLECPTVHTTTPAWYHHAYYVTAGTNAEVVAQMQAAINFVAANPTAVTSTLTLSYAWDELDEGGGGLIGTLGDPPASTPPYMNGIETALSAILP